MTLTARLALVLSLLAPLPAAAQDATDDTSEAIANGQRFGAWTVNCRAIAVGQTDCTLTQRVRRASDNAFVADMVATRNPDGETFMIARVPLGASLPAAFAMREAEAEDEEDVVEFAWQVCNREFCEALLRVDADKAATWSAEDNAMIAAFRPSPQAEPFLFQLSLNGMASGLDAIRP